MQSIGLLTETIAPMQVGTYPSPDPLEQRNWFAVFTRSHHEKRVVQHLTCRGIESFLPLYRAVHQWTNHREAVLELPLFPNYLFIRIAAYERIRTLEVPGVLTLVGNGNQLSALPDFEIECLRAGLRTRKFEPVPYLAAGLKVRIVRGPFAGLEGVVLRTKSCLRVILSVDFIAQSVAIEVDADELEPRALMSNVGDPVHAGFYDPSIASNSSHQLIKESRVF